MEISDELLEEFKGLYKEEFGEDLSDDKAREIAQRLLGFGLIVCRPLPEGSKIQSVTKVIDKECEKTGNEALDDLNEMLLTDKGLLAKEFAEGLDDMENLRFYISAALEYPEDHLRKVYQIAKDTPEDKIKKSRGALFAYLVKKCIVNV